MPSLLKDQFARSERYASRDFMFRCWITCWSNNKCSENKEILLNPSLSMRVAEGNLEKYKVCRTLYLKCN